MPLRIAVKFVSLVCCCAKPKSIKKLHETEVQNVDTHETTIKNDKSTQTIEYKSECKYDKSTQTMHKKPTIKSNKSDEFMNFEIV